jgi:archaellum component FlaC
MTKTVEQREKDLTEGVTWVVATAWSQAVSKVQKDLNAPIFVKSGNVAALADRYDKLQNEFNRNLGKKKAAVDLFGASESQLDKMDKETTGLLKEITDIANDESASVKKQGSGDPQAVITEWENSLKACQGQSKANKAVFDRWMKLDANYEKVMSDAIGKVKKEFAAAQAGLNGTNNQLNALEGEMRRAVGAYQNTATEMDRQDIAAAVRSFLAIFAKA